MELVDVEANPLRELHMTGMNAGTEETSETAGVHADDAYKGSSTPDDHDAERSNECICDL